MKTKLFSFLFVLINSISFAQINVTESFESGSVPSGWTTSNFGITNNGAVSCDGTYSLSVNLTQLGNGGVQTGNFVTQNYTSNGDPISFSAGYNKNNSSAGFSGNIKLYYAVNNSATFVQFASSTSFPVICFNDTGKITGNIASGVIPSGSLVRFKVEVNHSTNYAYVNVDDLEITQNGSTVNQTTTEYTFDNTYNNTVGTNPFSSSNTNFVADRHGNSTGAIQVIGAQSTATIPSTLLPTGAGARTISLWYKTNSNSGYPGVFAYGAAANSQTFGMYINPSGGPVFQGYANDTDFGGSYAVDTWQHVVISYDGGVVKMYKNGVYISSANKSLNTALSTFKLGNSSVGMTFDDLKIYNFVLSDTDVTSLYTNNTLSSSDFNQNNLKVAMYPNPVNDVLNIEIENEIKSVEIYNIQGQKVLQSSYKQIETNSLNSGIYMVRVEDVNGAVATQKLIKK
ncbi:LamG-like jellyroll fold domain-containing protein [Flavobacterium cyclinae]|uniref:LamG-like jellyroll fold domain-containing protein n=1 Tax=Flavobacterium cyclinae TaxID=2895947 RepID=UPI001E5CF6E4|nr:LamG-like jellyroll fold domain-containing protein [Flavobacterium cyclinae]UGS20742.1 T9SS type A sorting domain-containing protein [Flavobacterium cyclinae]